MKNLKKKKEKRKYINLITKLKKSDEDSSYEKENEQIKKLISGKINNIQINDFRKMLIEKRKNKEKGIKDIALKNKKIINSSFFYNIWIKSITKKEYKSSKNYKIFIQKIIFSLHKI